MKQCKKEFDEMRKHGFGSIVCMDIEMTKKYDKSSFVVNDTVSGKIFKNLEGDDLLAHSGLEEEG